MQCEIHKMTIIWTTSYHKILLANKGIPVLNEPPCHERTMGSSIIAPHILNISGRHKHLPSCPPLYPGYRLNRKLGDSQSLSECSCLATAVVNNLWNVQRSVLQRKFCWNCICQWVCTIPRKTCWFCISKHLSDNLQLLRYTPSILGLLIGGYTDKRNDLSTENTIWHPSVRLHCMGQWIHILSSGFLTTYKHTPYSDMTHLD
jgi:hypothetical protein